MTRLHSNTDLSRSRASLYEVSNLGLRSYLTMTEVIIVGAGILGLSSAFAIAENHQRPIAITVVAEHNPESTPYLPFYTSPWAGAHFRPFPSKNTAELKDYPLSRVTLARFKKLARTNPESSIQFVKGVEYFGAPDHFYQNLTEGYREEIDGFRVLSKAELPSGAQMGTEYDTYVVNLPHYLTFLYRKLKFHYDVRFVTARLTSLSEALRYAKTKTPVVVNCTGMGLQWTGGYDPACFPIRGQTLLINPPTGNKFENTTVTHQLATNEWTFCIPRPLDGGMILGGTKQPHETDAAPRPADTQALITRGSELFPELMKRNEKGEKYFDIVRVNVGFRPARDGGLNLSVENHNGINVINAYGAGGSGYEFSYGVGARVYQLLIGLKSKF